MAYRTNFETSWRVEPTRVLQFHPANDIEHHVPDHQPPPIYQNDLERHEIDNCLPQIEAVRRGLIEMHALTKGHYPGKRMKSNALPGLSSVGFWNCRRNQDWGLDPHRNEGMEIVFQETGDNTFEVDGRQHELHAGHLTVTRPWQLHQLGKPHILPGRLHWLILDVGVRRPNQIWQWPSWLVLDPRDLSSLARRLRLGTRSVWQTTPSVRDAFLEISHCVKNWQDGRMASRLAVAINRLLVEMLDLMAEETPREPPEPAARRRTVEWFLRDLSSHPSSCHQFWSLESMAAECGIGITTMAKYCRELVNNGPMAYLNLCRLEHAARELREQPHRSVTEIAMRAGFNSSQYFATCFRKRFNASPVGYRQNHTGNA